MTTRTERFGRLGEGVFDVLIVGGGINGAVSAAALAAHGVRVALIDRGDFAGETSMQSSNLVWGGIKYMESGELGLVRKLCRARNALMRAYPHAIAETRFLTTVPRGFRWPRSLLFLGAWAYWAIGGGFTKWPRILSRARIAREEPVVAVNESRGGVEYSDGLLVDGDARFVFGFVRRALELGASALNYARAESSTWTDGLWTTHVRDALGSTAVDVRARVLVNACGPFVDAYNHRSGITTAHHHVFSKGVHLITRRLTETSRVLAFFADDGRLFFVIPMGPRSCIGTTDTRVDGLPQHVTADDRAFVLANINARLRLPQPLTDADVIAERCGVRPLAVRRGQDPSGTADWTALSRKHVLELDAERRHVSIFGGKLTDCINVGRDVLAAVRRLGVEPAPRAPPWYGEGGAAERARFDLRVRELGLERDADGLPERLWRRHGPHAEALLEAIAADPTRAEVLIPLADVTRAEVEFAARHELVATLADFLRRRTRAEQVVPRATLHGLASLRTVSEILFGAAAERELAAYVSASRD